MLIAFGLTVMVLKSQEIQLHVRKNTQWQHPMLGPAVTPYFLHLKTRNTILPQVALQEHFVREISS